VVQKKLSIKKYLQIIRKSLTNLKKCSIISRCQVFLFDRCIVGDEMIDVKMAMLLDVYGGLLTKKQYDAMDLYYNEDYSLNEIAAHFNVSRQGIHENIKQATENLEKYENVLKICEKNKVLTKVTQQIKELLDEDSKKEEIVKLLEEVIKDV